MPCLEDAMQTMAKTAKLPKDDPAGRAPRKTLRSAKAVKNKASEPIKKQREMTRQRRTSYR